MEVIEGTAVRVEDSSIETQTIETQWAGETPFFLVIELADQPEAGNIGIDLDFPGWIAANTQYLRSPGAWWLIHKESQQPVMGIILEKGDQPYFTKHHVGNLMAHGEVVAYGLGKKKADGEMVRIWMLPNGLVCGGDDVDILAARMIG